MSTKKAYTFKFDMLILEATRTLGKKDGRSLTNYIEQVLKANIIESRKSKKK